MAYNTISTVIFLAAIVGMILMILRRLPEAAASQEQDQDESLRATLAMSGRRTLQAYYKVRAIVVFWSKRALNFALEAKGMKHPSLTNYRIRKIFRGRQHVSGPAGINAAAVAHAAAANVTDPAAVPAEAVKDEQFYLTQIREQPRELPRYAALAHFYVGQNNFSDAENVYDYLVKRDPSNSDYQAKLAYCKLHLKAYEDAAVWYEKSLALDPGHPNRYYNLALAYKVVGKRAQSAGAIRRAIELEPRNKKYRELFKSVAA